MAVEQRNTTVAFFKTVSTDVYINKFLKSIYITKLTKSHYGHIGTSNKCFIQRLQKRVSLNILLNQNIEH